MNKDNLYDYIVNHLKISKLGNDEEVLKYLDIIYNILDYEFVYQFRNMEPERFVEFVILTHSFAMQLKDLINNKTVTIDEDTLELYTTLVKLYKTENFIPIDDNKKNKAN